MFASRDGSREDCIDVQVHPSLYCSPYKVLSTKILCAVSCQKVEYFYFFLSTHKLIFNMCRSRNFHQVSGGGRGGGVQLSMKFQLLISTKTLKNKDLTFKFLDVYHAKKMLKCQLLVAF